MKNDMQWWSGFADLVTAGAAETAQRLEQVHLSIADETFNILAAVPVTRPVSEQVRKVHHGISRCSYRGVALGVKGLNLVLQQVICDKQATHRR